MNLIDRHYDKEPVFIKQFLTVLSICRSVLVFPASEIVILDFVGGGC